MICKLFWPQCVMCSIFMVNTRFSLMLLKFLKIQFFSKRHRLTTASVQPVSLWSHLKVKRLCAINISSCRQALWKQRCVDVGERRGSGTLPWKQRTSHQHAWKGFQSSPRFGVEHWEQEPPGTVVLLLQREETVGANWVRRIKLWPKTANWEENNQFLPTVSGRGC